MQVHLTLKSANVKTGPIPVRNALQALIFYSDLIAPDLPDNARADNFQIALDRAREALDKGAI